MTPAKAILLEPMRKNRVLQNRQLPARKLDLNPPGKKKESKKKKAGHGWPALKIALLTKVTA
jgi:hypothetical protein